MVNKKRIDYIEMVNFHRKYQRNLVWTKEEKQRLIDSINNWFPIPLILLMEKPQLFSYMERKIRDIRWVQNYIK